MNDAETKNLIKDLIGTLKMAREKLALYYARPNGNYQGGIEPKLLLDIIDKDIDKAKAFIEAK